MRLASRSAASASAAPAKVADVGATVHVATDDERDYWLPPPPTAPRPFRVCLGQPFMMNVLLLPFQVKYKIIILFFCLFC